MKRLINLVLIVIVSQYLIGCGKADTENTASDKPATKAENIEQKADNQNPAAVTNETKPVADADNTTDTPDVPVTLPDAAPIKGVQWIKGNPVAFQSGKIYVVEFWATWCGPCKVTIPHLTEIQKKFKDKGVTVVGISTESPETVKPFVDNMGDQMEYAVAVDTEGFMQKNYMEAFDKQGIPQAFIVNKSGKIAWEGHPMDNMETVLDMVVSGTFSPEAYAKQKAEEAALQKQIMEWFTSYFQTLQTDGLSDEVKQIGQNIIEKAPAEALNSFAWNILMNVAESNRDLEAAFKAAEKAYHVTEGKDPSVLDTYALALFHTGKVKEAIEIQQKAVDLAAEYPQAQAELKTRLKQYQAAIDEKI